MIAPAGEYRWRMVTSGIKRPGRLVETDQTEFGAA